MLYSYTHFSFQLSAVRSASSLSLFFLPLSAPIRQQQRQENFGDLRTGPIQDSSGQTVWGPSIHFKSITSMFCHLLHDATFPGSPPALVLSTHYLKPCCSQIFNDLVASAYIEHFSVLSPQPWYSVWPVGRDLFYLFTLNKTGILRLLKNWDERHDCWVLNNY